MRALSGGLLAATLVACSVIDSVSDYDGPPSGGGGGSAADGGASGADATSGGSVGDATTTDAKCSTVDDCDDGNPCTLDGCWGNLCTHAPTPGASCSDKDVCNGDEKCDASGTCKAGKPLALDDGNTCTDDACDSVKGVSHTLQTSPALQILECGTVTCPAGYFVRKLTCLSECGACNSLFCVNGVLCERACAPKLDVCCNNECGDDCPPGYTQTVTFLTEDCGCGPGNTATCQR